MHAANHKFIAWNLLLWPQQDTGNYLFWSCLGYQVSKNQSWFIVNCPSSSAAMTPWVCNKYRNMSITAIDSHEGWRQSTPTCTPYSTRHWFVTYKMTPLVNTKSQLFCYQLQGQRCFLYLMSLNSILVDGLND